MPPEDDFSALRYDALSNQGAVIGIGGARGPADARVKALSQRANVNSAMSAIILHQNDRRDVALYASAVGFGTQQHLRRRRNGRHERSGCHGREQKLPHVHSPFSPQPKTPYANSVADTLMDVNFHRKSGSAEGLAPICAAQLLGEQASGI
jgi:hypothetical protein